MFLHAVPMRAQVIASFALCLFFQVSRIVAAWSATGAYGDFGRRPRTTPMDEAVLRAYLGDLLEAVKSDEVAQSSWEEIHDYLRFASRRPCWKLRCYLGARVVHVPPRHAGLPLELQ